MNDYICTYCGDDLGGTGGLFGLQQDHVTPRYWPGAHAIRENFVWACPDCNRAKGTNDPATWFFLLVRRDGAVLGRNETLADRRVERLYRWWGEGIRQLAATVNDMLTAGAQS